MDITKRAASISFFASVFILALKFFAYSKTGSTAVLSDALESIVNVVAAGVAFFVMRAVSKPADDDHPYGHGKLEYFSSAFEGGLITFAGIAIAREAYLSFQHGIAPHDLDLGLWISILAGVLNAALGIYLLRIGRTHKSEALVASGKHVLSDVWSTVGAIIGLILVKLTGIAWFDPVAALLIAVQLSFSGYQIVRGAIAGLTDEVDRLAIKEISVAIEKNRRPGIIDIHLLRLIRSGKFHHVDAHLVVPEFWNVAQTHELTHEFEKAVVAAYPYEGEMAFHIDPCFRDFCSRCSLVDCPIRRQNFKERVPFTVDGLVGKPNRGGP